MSSEIKEIEGAMPRSGGKSGYRGRIHKLHLFADRIFKILLLGWDDFLSIVANVGGKLIALAALVLSATLSWLLRKGRTRRSIPLDSLKSLLGLILVATISVFATAGTLLFATFGGILGFRNTGEYPFREQIAAWLVLGGLLLALPLLVPEYALFKFSLIAAYSVGVMGFNFLYGQCGILSLGHAGFLLLGGYATAWFSNGTFGPSMPLIASITLGAAMTAVLGLLLGGPSLRIKDYYLVILTMTFSIAVPKMLKAPYFVSYSGLREGGLTLRSMRIPATLHSVKPVVLTYYHVMIPAALLLYVGYHLIHHGQIGRAFKTIKCDNEVSTILGIPVVRYKLLAFALNAFYTGFCGGLLTILTSYIHPDTYSILNSFDYLVASVVGGPLSVLGSVLGGAFLTYEQDFSLKLSQMVPGGRDLAHAFYGALLTFAIFFTPTGIAGELTRWLKSRFQSAARRGAYHVLPPPDYDYLPEKKSSATYGVQSLNG